MATNDDIAASLPPPPPPAPARREAAVNAALQRFDARDERARAPRREDGTAGPGRWWQGRPQATALISAVLVALIGIPVWISVDRQPLIDGSSRHPAAEAPAPRPAPTTLQADGLAPAAPQHAPTLDRIAPTPDRTAHDPDAQVAVEAAVPPPPAQIALAGQAAPPALLAERAEPAFERREDRSSAPVVSSGTEIAVTGARIASAPAVPREEADDASIIVTSAKASRARSAGRGDWNACTIVDPAPDLGRCRRFINPGAKGDAGRAAAHMADGLSRAWQRDFVGAIAEFDAAIALAPQSAFIYLNRGLSYQQNGEIDRAIADLNRAIRYAPHAARGYYHRSLLLRERGDRKRADRDAQRAISLDPRYADIIQ